MTSPMRQRDIEESLRRTKWPEPSPGLRDRVLSAAVVVAKPISWSDRVWFSRSWRLSAVGAALAIVLLDQLSGAQQSAAFTPAPQMLADARAVDETGEQLGLPADVTESLARRVIFGMTRPPAHQRLSSEALLAFELDSAGGER